MWSRIILCYSLVIFVYPPDPPIMNCEATVIIGFPEQLLKRISITHGSNEVFSLHCFHYVGQGRPAIMQLYTSLLHQESYVAQHLRRFTLQSPCLMDPDSIVSSFLLH